GPEKLAGLSIECIDDSGFSRHTCHNLASLTRFDSWIDPTHVGGARRHGGVDEQPFKWMLKIPMIDGVLVMPTDLSCIRVQSERRVVIQVLEIISREHELWRWSGHGCSNVEHVQFGIVARNHPGSDV